MSRFDSGYHLLFSHPEMVADLIQTFIHEPWVAWVDWPTLRRVNIKLHSISSAGAPIKRREGDMLWRADMMDKGRCYILAFLEFQTRPDRWMAVRLTAYVALSYQHLIKEGMLAAGGRLPPIFPIVLYNGERGWRAPLRLSELIALPEESPLWTWQPQMRYHVVGEREALEKGRSPIVSPVRSLFELEHARTASEVRSIVSQLVSALEHATPALRRDWATWLEQAHAAGGFGLDGSLTQDLREVKNMLSKNLQRLRREYLNEGREEGRLNGLQEGVAALRKTTLTLIELRFDPQLRAQLAPVIGTVNDLSSLQAIAEATLSTPDPEAFAALVQEIAG